MQPLIPGWRQIPRSVKRKKKFQQKATAVFLEDLRGHDDEDDESQNGEQNPFEEEEAQMTIGEMMEWRYIKAEQVKELVSLQLFANMSPGPRLTCFVPG